MKVCSRSDCTIVGPQPLENYHKDARNRNGLRSNCKTCSSALSKEWNENNAERRSERNRKWNENNAERRSERNRKRKYGLSAEDTNLRLLEQDGKCAVCRKMLVKYDVDHDHSCCPGEKVVCGGVCVRGLLCRKCNSIVIGAIETAFKLIGKSILEIPDILDSTEPAIVYLVSNALRMREERLGVS